MSNHVKSKREEVMQAKKGKFLRILRENGCYVERACRTIKITRPAVTYWRDTDEDFAAAMDAIKEVWIEGMEEELDRRAFEGVIKDIYYKGEVVGQLREYSDNLLMFRMKALRPEMYRDGPKASERVPLSDAELDAALQRRMQRVSKTTQDTPEVSEALN